MACSPAARPLPAAARARSGLGRAVGGEARQADLAGHAGDVDDAAAAPGGHLRRQRGDQEVRRPDVGGEQPVEGRRVQVGGRPEPRKPGVIDQDIDRADPLSQIAQLGQVAEVGGLEARLPAVFGDRVDHRDAAGGVSPVHDDFGAMPADLLGRRPADARGGPGSQGPNALEVWLLIHLLSSRWRSCVRFWLSTSTMDGAGTGGVSPA